MNKSSSKGGACCYDVVDPSGHFLLAANYETGSVAVFSLGEDGVIGEQLASFIEFPLSDASGAVPDRQERPHAHHVCSCVNYYMYMFVCTLYIYITPYAFIVCVKFRFQIGNTGILINFFFACRWSFPLPTHGLCLLWI